MGCGHGAGAGAEAAADFQQILDHRGYAPLSPLYPLAYLGLARAATMSGDAMKARKAYGDFLALWNNADAGLPAVVRDIMPMKSPWPANREQNLYDAGVTRSHTNGCGAK